MTQIIRSVGMLAIGVAACGRGDTRADTAASHPAGASSRAARVDGGPDDASSSRTATSSAVSSSAATDTASQRDGDAAPGKRNAPDSAVKLAVAARLPGRSFRDSISFVVAIRAGLRNPRWPVRTPPPLPGSLLPRNRIVAFYGNPLSKKMGVLGELPRDQMLARLDTVTAQWRAADPSTPVVPALQLIVSVAQGAPGKDGMYRQRSDTGLIEKVYAWAHQAHAIMILDVQPGKSTIQAELPRLLPFLARPDVHLAMDPEFNMHHNREGRAPGQKIGAMDASDVNYAIGQLAEIVSRYRLPPKMLIVHRFTTNMLQDVEGIRLDPRVQVVINMDGWGQPWLKFDTYRACEEAEPVEFTGFKLFFHNDTRKGDRLLTPRELLALRPRPSYIQYQ